jgi:hypothetical protein
MYLISNGDIMRPDGRYGKQRNSRMLHTLVRTSGNPEISLIRNR